MASYDANDDLVTTPRPSQTAFAQGSSYSTDDQSTLKTPTRESFPPFPGQMPPPDVPVPTSSYDTTARSGPRKGSMGRSASLRSAQSGGSGNATPTVDQDASDGDEGTDSDGRPSKKKKGQRFYCTDYPPCNLSFTRSEHLARHIRKHTGERPFQCHCLRRFSRLDNLRQHAQTVHLNEDIPSDSLAATGTRFQRQVRTDRVRPPGGGRSRASTIGSQPSSNVKGHSRNISTSSIGSASDYGGMDTHQQSQGPPVAMGPPSSTPSRGALGIDTYNGSGPDHPYYPYYTQNQNTGYSSPNSVYSADHTSPLAHTGLQSPIAMVPRGVTWVDPVHSRRMSVPSGGPPFQSPSSYGSNMSYMSPLATSSNASTFSNSSMITSPTSSTFSDHHEFSSDSSLKRRTWHPSSFSSYEQRPATSGLSYYQTPDAPKPLPSTQSAAIQNDLRLPGIASFDHRGTGKSSSSAMPGDPVSPMDVDSPARFEFPGDQQAYSAGFPYNRMQRSTQAPQRRPHHQYTKSAPYDLDSARDMDVSTDGSPNTARNQKRQAWYSGPLAQSNQVPQNPTMSTSPANSSGSEAPYTPSAVSIPDYQPAIIHSNGVVEPLPHGAIDDPSKADQFVNASHSLQRNLQNQQQPLSKDMSPPRNNSDMGRLDALVAVATSENQATAT